MAIAERDRNGPEAHASAEQRYRDLIEWLPAIVYEAAVGADGEWFYVSPQARDVLGYSATEFMHNPGLFTSRLHPDDRDEVMELERTEAEMARDEDVTMVSEYRMLHRDGRIVWMRDAARLVVSADRPPYWRGVLVDITQTRAAERALAESHERYRSLIASLPVCAYHADPAAQHRRQFLSTQLRKLLGYTLEEWDADPGRWESSLHPSDRSRVLRDEERHVTMAIGTPWVSEYRLISRSGNVVWVRDRAVVAEDTDGRRVIDGILTDVTVERGDGGESRVRDVLRITCSSCGAVHAAETAGPCLECGSGDVEATSMNALLIELAEVRRQVESLLDGVHQHLETVSGKPAGTPPPETPIPSVGRRVFTRPTQG